MWYAIFRWQLSPISAFVHYMIGRNFQNGRCQHLSRNPLPWTSLVCLSHIRTDRFQITCGISTHSFDVQASQEANWPGKRWMWFRPCSKSLHHFGWRLPHLFYTARIPEITARPLESAHQVVLSSDKSSSHNKKKWNISRAPCCSIYIRARLRGFQSSSSQSQRLIYPPIEWHLQIESEIIIPSTITKEDI